MNIIIPTKLKDEYVKQFHQLYLKHFGEDLTFDESYDKALRLVQFMATILQSRGAYFPNPA